QGKRPEQFGKFRNLIGFLFHLYLSDHHGFFMKNRTEQMRRALAGVMSTADGFAVHRDALSGNSMLTQNPLSNPVVDRIRIQLLQDPADGGFRRRFPALRSQTLQSV